jgi:hypothetical protein
VGADWRNALRQGLGPQFNGLSKEWEHLCRSFNRQLWTVAKDCDLLKTLMKLVAVADEACEGVGAPEDTGEDDHFLQQTRAFLRDDATLGVRVDPTRVRVLPRMHTPQNGLTERSLSLYLSMCDAGEVTPRWLSTPFLQNDSINLLLIPWPHEVLVSQFRDVTDTATTDLPDGFGFFTYDFLKGDDLIALAGPLYAEAKRKLGRIDGVVLPELSITDEQFRALRDSLPPECFLVAGVGRAGVDSQRGGNEVRLSFPPLQEVVQKKHHPWKLDESQVIQYGLGGVLSPSREWWEYADLADRRLDFIAMSEDLVICALVL